MNELDNRFIMKFFYISVFIIVGFIYNCFCIRANYAGALSSKKVIYLKIKPSTTDPSIKSFDSPHLVIYNPSLKQGKLLFYMSGTGGVPEKDGADELFFATAIEQGYRVINLSYINKQGVSNICVGTNLANDADCAEKFRIKRIYGKNTTSLISDEPQDAIMNRFVKLLIYLSVFDKKGNWEMYLENGEPKWENIAIAGCSQGGGMAAFIAKQVCVARVIIFSGGWDFSNKKKIAGWYFRESVTPPDRWYGNYHIAEHAAAPIAATYKAMAIPENHIYPLSLEVHQGHSANPAHVEGIRNINYKPVWIEMLGNGN
jgi:hypothetical protein